MKRWCLFPIIQKLNIGETLRSMINVTYINNVAN